MEPFSYERILANGGNESFPAGGGLISRLAIGADGVRVGRHGRRVAVGERWEQWGRVRVVGRIGGEFPLARDGPFANGPYGMAGKLL